MGAIIKFSFTIFSALLIMACGEMSGQQEKEVHLRVAAYNVEVGSNATAQEIGEALLPYDLDIVCFSEAPGGGWTEDVAKVLGLSHIVVGRYTTAGHQDKYKSIASRTPLYDYEEIPMTDTLHTVTKARTAINDKEITIYSVHFPFGWRDAEHIRETTAKLAHFAYYLREKQDVETSILLGDFNFIPSNDNYISNDYEMFADAGFVPSWNDLGTDITKLNTHNAFDSTDIGSGKVIDHILYNPSKVKALDGSIIEMERPLSDHKPVWALLQVN